MHGDIGVPYDKEGNMAKKKARKKKVSSKVARRKKKAVKTRSRTRSRFVYPGFRGGFTLVVELVYDAPVCF